LKETGVILVCLLVLFFIFGQLVKILQELIVFDKHPHIFLIRIKSLQLFNKFCLNRGVGFYICDSWRRPDVVFVEGEAVGRDEVGWASRILDGNIFVGACCDVRSFHKLREPPVRRQ